VSLWASASLPTTICDTLQLQHSTSLHLCVLELFTLQHCVQRTAAAAAPSLIQILAILLDGLLQGKGGMI
jgi:hypothetical protein